MESSKYQNPEQSLEEESLVSQFLDAKLEKASQTTEESDCPRRDGNPKTKKVMPDFSFKFGNHRIGESVEYEVQLVESFRVFGRQIAESYKFKTQFSKLEKLGNKIEALTFPAKKWFGNKNESFVEKRKKQLEEYLNKLAKMKSEHFYEFVHQVKQAHLLADNKKNFSL